MSTSRSNESAVAQTVRSWLEGLGYSTLHDLEIVVGEPIREHGGQSSSDVKRITSELGSLKTKKGVANA